MSVKVNLDALVVREDFLVSGVGDEAPTKPSIEIRELETDQLFFLGLRKPDFQRETSEWDPKRVVGLIKSFLEGQLIPAVILWKNKDLLFIIDGSHRLSALISWVQDDYGDGEISQKFFGHSIPEDQLRVAERTREQVLKEIGSYKDHLDAPRNPSAYGAEFVAKARRLATTSLQLQWVRGDATVAEESFKRINQHAAQIKPQELELIESRRKPSAIAARSIIRRGTGHSYWSTFPSDIQNDIKKQASAIHRLIFEPNLKYPIKSLDLPLGGAVYSSTSLRMVYDLVRMCNDTRKELDDVDGKLTLSYLSRTKRVVQLLLSNEPSSLGLHPAVYFYSWTGKQQPVLLLTIASLIIGLDRNKMLPEFIRRRGELERFLIGNRTLINQLVRKFGTKDSGSKHILEFYADVLKMIGKDFSSDEVVAKLSRSDGKYSYLQPNETPYDGVSATRYSTQVRSGLFIQKLLAGAPKCAICGGLILSQSMSVDHIDRREDGGLATQANSQITHPYCNTGYKESPAYRERSRAIDGNVV